MSAAAIVKRCRKCGTEKPRFQFPRRRRSPDGLHVYCRACLKTYNRVTRGQLRSL